jgi:hypothetical protein
LGIDFSYLFAAKLHGVQASGPTRGFREGEEIIAIVASTTCFLTALAVKLYLGAAATSIGKHLATPASLQHGQVDGKEAM